MRAQHLFCDADPSIKCHVSGRVLALAPRPTERAGGARSLCRLFVSRVATNTRCGIGWYMRAAWAHGESGCFRWGKALVDNSRTRFFATAVGGPAEFATVISFDDAAR